MRTFSVVLPANDTKPERKVDVHFTYPWQRARFRGQDLQVKTAVVSFGELKREATKEEKPLYRFYGHGKVKWPVGAPEIRTIAGKKIADTAHSRLLSPRISETAKLALKEVAKLLPSNFRLSVRNLVQVSKTEASKEALKLALKEATTNGSVSYFDRCLIWKEFHAEFRTGVVPLPPNEAPVRPALILANEAGLTIPESTHVH